MFHTMRTTRIAIAVSLYCLLLAASSACGSSEPSCEECLATRETPISPDGCWPYCDGEEPPDVRSWSGTVSIVPVLIVRDPNAVQPTPFMFQSQLTLSSVALSGVCSDPIPLSDGRFRSSSGMTCGRVIVHAFLAQDSTDTWTSCDDAIASLQALDVTVRVDGTLYAEGGMIITGCGRTWNTVLLQARASQ